MKTEHACDIARDLMPLELDGVCSQGSQCFLKSHLETCAPCQEIYQKMKADSVSLDLPSLESSQEAALGKRIRQAGKKLKWLYRLLAVCGAATILILCIFIVQTLRWNHIAKAPLDSYELTLSSYDDYVHVDLAYSFTHLRSAGHDVQTVSDENGESVVITYYVEYYPVRAKTQTLIDPAYRHTLLSTVQFCLQDGLLYTVSQDSIRFIEPSQTADSSLSPPIPDLPVREVRITDGLQTRAIYTQGDVLEEKKHANGIESWN